MSRRCEISGKGVLTGNNVTLNSTTLSVNNIESKDTTSNLILDTAEKGNDNFKIQFNRELISIQNTDLRLTTLNESNATIE